MHSSISKHKAYYFLKVKNLTCNLHLHVQPPLGQTLVESAMYCVSLLRWSVRLPNLVPNLVLSLDTLLLERDCFLSDFSSVSFLCSFSCT